LSESKILEKSPDGHSYSSPPSLKKVTAVKI
jgi:hypothetical protein